MAKFTVMSDSSCDVHPDQIEKHSISLIPYLVTIDGFNYLKDGVDISLDDFYEALIVKKIFPKTSLPPIEDYCQAFRKSISENNLDILCICLTSKFSGSYQSATIARNIVKEEFPEREIAVIDSTLCTGGQAMIVLEAVKLMEKDCSLSEVFEYIEKIKNSVRLMFTVNSLEYLRKGGRIGKVTALAGSLLNIKPLISMTNGELIPYSKIRGRKKAIQEIIDIMIKDTRNNLNSYSFCVVHSECLEDAEYIQDELIKIGCRIEQPIYRIGVTIGAHIGPSVVGIGYIKNY